MSDSQCIRGGRFKRFKVERGCLGGNGFGGNGFGGNGFSGTPERAKGTSKVLPSGIKRPDGTAGV